MEVTIHPISCANTHNDVTDLVNHEMVKNTETLLFHDGGRYHI